MKKILTLTAIALSLNTAYAGDGDVNETQKFRFGLKVTPTLDWYKPDGKIISGNGVVLKFGGGLITEFRLTKVVSLQTGFQVDLSGGKVHYDNNKTAANGNYVSYFYKDDKIVPHLDENIPTNYDSINPATYTHYQLNDRKYNISYLTIPLTLKMKTKEIGVMTYYGQFGINTSIRWKAKALDNVVVLSKTDNGHNENNKEVDVTKDVQLFHETLNVGFGAEMNLSGSTSLTFGLNYLYGFTNSVKGTSNYLRKTTNDASGAAPTNSDLPQVLKSNSVALTVGILF